MTRLFPVEARPDRQAPGGRAGIGGHHRVNSGVTDVWLTPPEILTELGPFDLDPCAADPRPWPTAFRCFTKADDGLAQEWHGRVWLNPPYGQDIGRWMERLAAHGEGTALVFARTETDWFHRWVWPHASGLRFLRGRLNFHRPDGTRSRYNAGGPSVLVAYGPVDRQRLRDANLSGAFVPLTPGGAR